MPLKQKTAARIKRRDILFDMIDEHGAVVHAHVEREALIDYAGQRSIQGEPDEILEAALPEILQVASDKYDSYKLKPTRIYVLSRDLEPRRP